ncbi:glycosyltransferase family 2 protein [Cumulibacter soli]|uniref:glycosyltransferase family 2 protein n=1 Tax=Cumulibacter soli TaxID=2546344 RepID=UPI0010681FD0|nr:glycosyltransferase family 2 protein [Cumulibacter soli]
MNTPPPVRAVDEVTVVVVTFSPGEHLAAFLDSLQDAAQCPPRVIMVDNGSVDGSVEAAEGRDGVELIRTGSNLGFGSAANIGAAEVVTDWILVANPDLVWGPGSIDALLDAARRWPNAAAIGPAITTADDELYPSARLLPSIGIGAGHAIFGAIWPTNPWTRTYRAEAEAIGERTTGWISGSCMLMRKDAFDSLGGFDAGYFMYFEDVDLCARLHDEGHEVVYAPGTVVLHNQGHAANREPSRMVAEHHRSAYRYLSRRYSGLRWAPLRLVLRCGLAARQAIAQRSATVRGGAPPRRGADELPSNETSRDT